MTKPEAWSWRVFWGGFWRGFGQMMTGFIALHLLLAIFADASSADFESAVTGFAFAFFLSAFFGYGSGEASVREWRENAN